MFHRKRKSIKLFKEGIFMSDTYISGTTSNSQEKIRQIQNNFGIAAADYVTSKVHASGQDLAWAVEVSTLTGTERVLDIATGGGHTAFALAPYAAEVVALDITPQMLVVARQAATERGLSNISFIEGDAAQLPAPDASFDLVACRQAAHHFPHIRQSVQEWARVLKPSGKIILVDSVSPEEPDADAFLEEVEILRDPSHVRSQRISQWTALLQEAGFIITITRSSGIVLEIADWTRRMRTPAASIARIEHLLRTASPAIRELLHIEEQNSLLSFTLPIALIAATRP
jgi:ubiquinone/menaquinone biosynthesis C-methylase UbiE